MFFSLELFLRLDLVKCLLLELTFVKLHLLEHVLARNRHQGVVMRREGDLGDTCRILSHWITGLARGKNNSRQNVFAKTLVKYFITFKILVILTRYS